MNRQYLPYPKTIPKTMVLALSCLIWMQNTQGQICSNPSIIFGLNSSGQIYPINTTNANVGAQINSVAYGGLAANQSNAIGFSNLYNSFFYFHRNPSTANQKFIEYNTTTSTYVTCAPCP
ncbi:MAG TPA: hypothetical protein VNV85_04045, partial [Puia sp.]|nr:hypothetical protein [Puia sp.]